MHYNMFPSMHPSVHPSYIQLPFTGLLWADGFIQLTVVKGKGWAAQQSITGLTHIDTQPFRLLYYYYFLNNHYKYQPVKVFSTNP